MSNELICHVDLLATVAALVGKPLPADAGPDSFNVLPALLAEKPAKPCRESLVHQPAADVAGDPQGAVEADPGRRQEEEGRAGPELFNLADDLAEATNLAAENPEVVKELSALLAKVREGPRSRP